MTQPIQEPSTPRRLTSFGFGQDQLFRRPGPSSTAGDIVWARRAQYAASDQNIPDGIETNLELNTFFTDYSTYFEAYDVGSRDGITVLVDGLYSITFRVFWDTWPGDNGIIFNGIDPDAWAGYGISASAGGGGSNTLSHAGGLPGVRLNAGQDIYPTIWNGDTVDHAVAGICGTFFEMVFLGTATTIYTGCELNPAS